MVRTSAPDVAEHARGSWDEHRGRAHKGEEQPDRQQDLGRLESLFPRLQLAGGACALHVIPHLPLCPR